MCKLVGIQPPVEYSVLREAVFNKLERDKSQLEAVEWYVSVLSLFLFFK